MIDHSTAMAAYKKRMDQILSDASNRELSQTEADEYDQLEALYNQRRAASIGNAFAYVPGNNSPSESERDRAPGFARLSYQDSFKEYCQRHCPSVYQNKRNVPTDFDYNEFWGAELHLTKRNTEWRTVYGLEAGIAGGSAGGAAPVIATIWSHDVVDLIRAKTFLFKVGAQTVPLPSAVYNQPIWCADVAPAYASEVASLSLDTTPQLAANVVFDSTGAFVDLTGASLEALEDAYNQGGLNALLQNSIAQKYARLIESVAIYGQSGSTGNPGLVNESTNGSMMTQSMGTDGAAPSDYSDISKAVAQVRAQSVEPTAIVAHPSVVSQYAQLVDTLGQPMRPTPDIEKFMPMTDSALLNGYTETQGSSNVASSLYVADWSAVHVGFRTDPAVQTRGLDQRYVDNQIMAWLTRMRMSVRTVQVAQRVCALQGILA